VTNDNVVKGWYFASKIEVVDAATHKYKVCVSPEPIQKSSETLRGIDVDKAIDNTVTLDLKVNDVLSMNNDVLILNALTIVSINHNCITYKINTAIYDKDDSYQGRYYEAATTIMGNITAGNPKDFNEHTIWCLAKPTIGVVDIVKYNVIAGGWGCKAYGNASLTSGRQNTIYGDYGVAFGRQNTAGYACVTAGQQCTNHQYNYGNVFGFNLTTTNSFQSLFGIGTGVEVDKDIFFGVYTNVERSSLSGSLSLGVYHKYIAVNGTRNLLVGSNINTDTTTGNKIGNKISRSIIMGSTNSADTGDNGSDAQNVFVGGYNNSLSSDTNNTNISNSFIYGQNNSTSKANSITLGKGLINKVNAGCVVGQFNKESTTSQFIVGGGSSASSRKNLFEVNSTGFIIPLFNSAGAATNNYVQVQAIEDSNGSILLKLTKI
jgi:hypothetical protein